MVRWFTVVRWDKVGFQFRHTTPRAETQLVKDMENEIAPAFIQGIATGTKWEFWLSQQRPA